MLIIVPVMGPALSKSDMATIFLLLFLMSGFPLKITRALLGGGETGSMYVQR